MAYQHNEGVVVTGGAFNATNAAVGRGAKIIQTASAGSQAAQDVQLKLDALLQLLNQHRDQVSNADEVSEATKSVKEELTKDKPNRLTLKSLLGGITESVKSVGALAVAAEALKTAVVALIGL